jgi:hypothetical protein
MSRPVTRRPLEALRRSDDPENSHVAAERWYPTGQTCLDRCLDLLLYRHGEWVDASEFVDPAIGGLNATRRLRELREGDPNVETRLKPETANTWQWRYRGARPVPAPRHVADDRGVAKVAKKADQKRRATQRGRASSVQHQQPITSKRRNETPEEKEARVRQARLERDLEQASANARR